MCAPQFLFHQRNLCGSLIILHTFYTLNDPARESRTGQQRVVKHNNINYNNYCFSVTYILLLYRLDTYLYVPLLVIATKGYKH